MLALHLRRGRWQRVDHVKRAGAGTRREVLPLPRGESYGYDSYYFNGLLSEKLELTQTKRGNSWAWVKIPGHERNEALDCRNYALGGFRIINPDMEAVERRLKNMPDPQQPKKAAAPRQRRTNTAAQYFDEW